MTDTHIDASIETDKDSMTTGTGSTLTGDVRVIYDDTQDPAAIFTLITRIRDKIAEVMQ